MITWSQTLGWRYAGQISAVARTLMVHRGILHVCVQKKKYTYNITGYGSTPYIGIAMVFVFSPYILKYSSYFQFQASLTFN